MIATAQIASKYIKGLYYYPNFITKSQKHIIYSLINSLPWCTRLMRHQQYYGIKYFQTNHNDQILQNKQSIQQAHHEKLDHFKWLIDRMIFQVPIFQLSNPPNQCLVNKYTKRHSLGLHVEDKLCYGPIIAGLSIGSKQYLRLNHESQEQKKFYIQLEDCSLYILRDQARQNYRHGIGKTINELLKNQPYLQACDLDEKKIMNSKFIDFGDSAKLWNPIVQKR